MRCLQIRDTLRLKIPFGETLLLAALFLLVAVGASEGVARVIAAQNSTLVPSVGSPHRQFEISLARLEAFARAGRVDCIFLGSSVVYRGINPDAFGEAYAAVTGQPLRCFNLGIQALTASTAAKLARIVVEDYHPGLLIYGITAHDLSAAAGAGVLQALEEMPWFAYRTGQFNFEGWLVEHSYALRDYLVQRDWMRPSYAAYVSGTRADEAAILGNGFNPRHGTNLTPGKPLTPHQRRRLARLYGQFAIGSAHLQGLEQLLRLDSPATRVLIVEMPIHPQLLDFFPNGKRDYDAFVTTVERAAAAHHVPLWRALSADALPDTIWYDMGHMNAEGAEFYSRWLGRGLGEAVVNHTVPDLRRLAHEP
jgi:hypothetical protein